MRANGRGVADALPGRTSWRDTGAHTRARRSTSAQSASTGSCAATTCRSTPSGTWRGKGRRCGSWRWRNSSGCRRQRHRDDTPGLCCRALPHADSLTPLHSPNSYTCTHTHAVCLCVCVHLALLYHSYSHSLQIRHWHLAMQAPATEVMLYSLSCL